jgi:hypothetical protein
VKTDEMISSFQTIIALANKGLSATCRTTATHRGRGLTLGHPAAIGNCARLDPDWFGSDLIWIERSRFSGCKGQRQICLPARRGWLRHLHTSGGVAVMRCFSGSFDRVFSFGPFRDRLAASLPLPLPALEAVRVWINISAVTDARSAAAAPLSAVARSGTRSGVKRSQAQWFRVALRWWEANNSGC